MIEVFGIDLIETCGGGGQFYEATALFPRREERVKTALKNR